MLIPHSYEPTSEERYEIMFRNRMKKAKHLRERFELFIIDLENSKMKTTDKASIKRELLNVFGRIDKAKIK